MRMRSKYGSAILVLIGWLACAGMFSAVAFGAVETTTVQGKVVIPNGATATGGAIAYSLSQSGSTPDTGTGQQQAVGGRQTATVAADGSVSFPIIPNDAITPSGTFYDVVLTTTGPVRAYWVEKWSVTTSPDPVNIGAITRLEVAPGITVGSFVKYVATEPSGACTGADVPTFAQNTNRLCECVSSAWSCGLALGTADSNTPTGTWDFVGGKLRFQRGTCPPLAANCDSEIEEGVLFLCDTALSLFSGYACLDSTQGWRSILVESSKNPPPGYTGTDLGNFTSSRTFVGKPVGATSENVQIEFLIDGENSEAHAQYAVHDRDTGDILGVFGVTGIGQFEVLTDRAAPSNADASITFGCATYTAGGVCIQLTRNCLENDVAGGEVCPELQKTVYRILENGPVTGGAVGDDKFHMEWGTEELWMSYTGECRNEVLGSGIDRTARTEIINNALAAECVLVDSPGPPAYVYDQEYSREFEDDFVIDKKETFDNTRDNPPSPCPAPQTYCELCPAITGKKDAFKWKGKGIDWQRPYTGAFWRDTLPTKCEDGDRLWWRAPGGQPRLCACDAQADADGAFEIADGSGIACTAVPTSGGDVTAVGPGCADGECLTDGKATTGAIMAVWEGTGIDANQIQILAPANPATASAFTIPDANSNPIQPLTCSGTDKVSALGSTGAITCTADDDVPEAGDYTALTGGDGIVNSPTGTVATQSDETGFLEDLGVGDLTCGAGTAGKLAVNDVDPVQYCDGAATPVRRTAAFADDSGNATGLACSAACVSSAEADATFVLDTESPAAADITGSFSVGLTVGVNSVALPGDTTGNFVASVTNGLGITGGDGGSEAVALTLALKTDDTLAGNPALGIEECVFTKDGAGSGGFLCEGTTANTNEQLYLFPSADGVDTTLEITALGQTIEDAELASNYSGIGACTNQFPRTLNDNAAPTCATVDVSADTNLTAGRSLTLTGDDVAADAELFTDTKCVNIDPAATTTDWFFFRAETAITVTGIDCIVDAATSVVMTLRECDANGGTCVATEAAITCATTNTTEAAGIDDAAVDAGDWLRVLRGTVTGSPAQATLCMTFTVND